jgi:hypothetical protein
MQTVSTIEAQLPNGLHDAVLRCYGVDLERKTAWLYFDVWVGDLDSKVEEERERYRPGTLTLKDLRYFVVEPPSGKITLTIEPFASSASDPKHDRINPSVELPEPPSGTFQASFFLYLLEAFIHICAGEAHFEYEA